MAVKTSKPDFCSSLLAKYQNWRKQHPSPEYQKWRDRFIYRRLKIALILAVFYLAILTPINYHQLFIDYQQIQSNLERLQASELLSGFRHFAIIGHGTMTFLLVVIGMLYQRQWGRKHPTFLFILFFFTISSSDLIIGTFVGIPVTPDISSFMIMVILFPVNWQLHALCQSLEIAYYFIIYPILGMTAIANNSIYQIPEIFNLLFLTICCDIGTYLYEKLKQSEIAANHRLKVFIHSISHDLRTPVLGTNMLLQSFMRKADNQSIHLITSEVELLLKGNDRLLDLMNALLEGYTQEKSDLKINPQPAKFSDLVESVIHDLQLPIDKKQFQITNKISPNLPLILADENQIWRVLSNLVTNALKHNPPQTHLIFDAKIITTSPTRILKFFLQDNGIGIPPHQQEHLFEIYTRGGKSDKIPGLGVGLYICREIIHKHGGNIGVKSNPDGGSIFWFTLPCITESSQN